MENATEERREETKEEAEPKEDETQSNLKGVHLTLVDM